MLLLSWNVAGWSSTSQAIRESFGSLHEFFACTGADIICLQECKGTLTKLNASPVEMGASDPPVHRRPRVPPLSRLAADQRNRQPRQTGRNSGSPAFTSTSGGCNDGIEGWESFWSFSSKKHRGFNGVVTFARKGLTWRCDSQPFLQEEYNDEGRVVVTHHSSFVLVNVYVPNARGGARHAFKFGFLRALEDTMERLRQETHKPVILAGDLNMTYRAYDAAWSLRRIHLGALVELELHAKDMTEDAWRVHFPQLTKAALQRMIHMIANELCSQALEWSALLKRSEARGDVGDGVATLSSVAALSSSLSSASSPKTTVVSVDVEVDSGIPDTVDRDALLALCASLVQRGLSEGASGGNGKTGGSGGGRGGHNFDAPPVSLQTLYNVGFRSVHSSNFVRSFPCAHNSELYAVVHYCGLAPHADSSVEFMRRLLQLPLPVSTASLPYRFPWRTGAVHPEAQRLVEGASRTRMWDTFLLTEEIQRLGVVGATDATLVDGLLLQEVGRPQLKPYCPCPYTCWDQSRNRRLENEGTRLDYILVDTDLLPAVVCRAETVNNTLPRSSSADTSAAVEDFFSEVQGQRYRDGVLRTMANGAYPPAPFDGTGMPAVTDQARELCCEGLPSTGLFVTPPQFSDHIGVALLLDLSALSGSGDGELVHRTGKLVEDHKCVYRPPVGLQSFFAIAAANQTSSTASTPPPDDATPIRVVPKSPNFCANTAETPRAGNKHKPESNVASAMTSSRQDVLESPPPTKLRTEGAAIVVPAKDDSEPSVIDVDDI